MPAPPLIAITMDVVDDGRRYRVGRSYAAMVRDAGGLPVHLPCDAGAIALYLERCDGVVLTGGDDPMMEPWGVPTDPRVTPLHPDRQRFEMALLAALDNRPKMPVLGVCLGMQLMGLHAGGMLDQWLPDAIETAPLHWDHGSHAIAGTLGAGTVHSHHRQALHDAGALEVTATATDGVIEAVAATDRAYYVGVQWHPERTEDVALGAGLFEMLVAATRG